MNASNVWLDKKFYRETICNKVDTEALKEYAEKVDEEERKEPADNIQALNITQKETAEEEAKRKFRSKVVEGYPIREERWVNHNIGKNRLRKELKRNAHDKKRGKYNNWSEKPRTYAHDSEELQEGGANVRDHGIAYGGCLRGGKAHTTSMGKKKRERRERRGKSRRFGGKSIQRKKKMAAARNEDFEGVGHDIRNMGRGTREQMNAATRMESNVTPNGRKKHHPLRGQKNCLKNMKNEKSCRFRRTNARAIHGTAEKWKESRGINTRPTKLNKHKEYARKCQISTRKMLAEIDKLTVKDRSRTALANISIEILTPLIKEQTEEHLQRNLKVKKVQAGFTRGSRVEGSLLMLRRCVENPSNMIQPLPATAIDFSKVIDSVKGERVNWNPYKFHSRQEHKWVSSPALQRRQDHWQTSWERTEISPGWKSPVESNRDVLAQPLFLNQQHAAKQKN